VKGGTLFSGISAPELAAPDIDWRWCAETDPFASAVLAARFPHSVNLGDVTKVDWDAVEPVDIVAFGSPCQPFSVAGQRAGLDDPRGDMAFVGLRAIDRIRPRWMVFENVPGLLSSDEWRDFGAFLGALGQCGYGFAYRILDAQYFGVPQRRRRVFVVGHLGDWRPSAAVLFEQESLCWHPAPRREARERVAHGAGNGFAFGGNNTAGPIEVATAVRCGSSGANGHYDFESETFVTHSLRVDGFDASEGGTGRGTPIIAFHGADGDPMFSMNADTPHGGFNGMSVRRLTPVECARLQGFPDTFLDIVYRGKPAADGPKYRALGNAMCVPVVRWILGRVIMTDALS
jgi:DNA (cytosine-5)-methyltransferase 1